MGAWVQSYGMREEGMSLWFVWLLILKAVYSSLLTIST